MSTPKFQNSLTAQIAEFLVSIGIPIRAGKLVEPTFFPGMKIESGGIVIDESRLKHPGDLLHEAGHIAVLEGDARAKASGDVGPNGGAELSALAWSYAAAVHLGLDASVVFHEDSYQGGHDAMIENFEEGRYIGVPGLQRYGLTADSKQASQLGVRPYPFMLQWMRRD